MRPRFLRIREFCDQYKCGKTYTYELIRKGQIKAVKAGTNTLIDVESAEAWADQLPAA